MKHSRNSSASSSGGSSASTSRLGAGFMALFALPFAGVGVFMAGLLVSTLLEYAAMRSWDQVPCTVLSAELHRRTSDNSTTYRVEARYLYVIDQRPYEATRVGIHSGSDNIGSFHQDAYAELKRHEESGEPFRCYVDPGNLDNAILYRDLRWGMVAFMGLFGAVFGGVGVGLLGTALVSGLRAREQQHQVQAHPDEPWLWQQQWASGQIICSGKMTMYFLLGFALFWNLVSTPLLFILPEEIFEKGNTLAWLGMLFPLVGLGLIVAAVWSVLRWRKYGASTFQMASVPGVIGGSLAGVIRATKPLDPAEGFRLVLRCIERQTTGSGKKRSTTENTLWQDEQVIARGLELPGAEGTAIPVLFEVPYDMPASTVDGGNGTIIWRLEASAKVPGIDYGATFDVPVFKTPESRPDFQLDRSAIADYVAQPEPEVALRRAGVWHEPSPGGWGDRFVFPMFRHVGAIAGMLAFSAIWIGAIVLMLHLGAPLLFPIVFGLFGAVIVAILADMMFYRSVVDATAEGVSVRGGLFGLGRTTYIAASDLKDLAPKPWGQVGSRTLYNVVADLTDGRTVMLGKRLPNKAAAESVIERMRAAIDQSRVVRR